MPETRFKEEENYGDKEKEDEEERNKEKKAVWPELKLSLNARIVNNLNSLFDRTFIWQHKKLIRCHES